MPATNPLKVLLWRARSLGIAAAIAFGLGLGTLLLPHGLISPELVGHTPFLITAAITGALTLGFAVYFILALRALMAEARAADQFYRGVHAAVLSAFSMSVMAIGIGLGATYWVALGDHYFALKALPFALLCTVACFRMEGIVAQWIGRRG